MDGVSAAWRKSSYSGNEGNCVEVGTVPGLVAVRDTKDQASGPVLRVTAEAWQTFTSGIN
ncbi:MAG TPA: DUF397 domain-containing protein [Trebonia sp.]|jgi:hypothetical protein|nr:DUF397 domain-containing protein [Trebonia sp.]